MSAPTAYWHQFRGNHGQKTLIIPNDAEELPVCPVFRLNLERILVEGGYNLGSIRKIQLGRNPCQHAYVVQYFDKGIPYVYVVEGKRNAYETAQNLPGYGPTYHI